MIYPTSSEDFNLIELYEFDDRHVFKFEVNSNKYVIRLTKDIISMTTQNTVNCMKIAKRHLGDIIPYVFHHGIINDENYIIMEYIEGDNLANVWRESSEAHKIKIKEQLSNIVRNMRDVKFNFIGSLTSIEENIVPGPITDYNIVEGRNVDSWDRGPFYNINEWFISGLALEAHNIKDKTIYDKILSLIGYIQSHRFNHTEFVLSHNDLDVWNILIDNQYNITGIIDWEHGGAYPKHWEYLKRKFVNSPLESIFETHVDKDVMELENIKSKISDEKEEILQMIDEFITLVDRRDK